MNYNADRKTPVKLWN